MSLYEKTWVNLKKFNKRKNVVRKLKQKYPRLNGYDGECMLSNYWLARLFLRFE
jgi:hypothetical protein